MCIRNSYVNMKSELFKIIWKFDQNWRKFSLNDMVHGVDANYKL